MEDLVSLEVTGGKGGGNRFTGELVGWDQPISSKPDTMDAVNSAGSVAATEVVVVSTSDEVGTPERTAWRTTNATAIVFPKGMVHNPPIQAKTISIRPARPRIPRRHIGLWKVVPIGAMLG